MAQTIKHPPLCRVLEKSMHCCWLQKNFKKLAIAILTVYKALFLFFTCITSETKNWCASGWHININKWRRREYRYWPQWSSTWEGSMLNTIALWDCFRDVITSFKVREVVTPRCHGTKICEWQWTENVTEKVFVLFQSSSILFNFI